MTQKLLFITGTTIGLTIGIAAAAALWPVFYGFAWASLYGDNDWPRYWYIPFVIIDLIVIIVFCRSGIKFGARFNQYLIAKGKDTKSIRIFLQAVLIFYYLVLILAALIFYADIKYQKKAEQLAQNKYELSKRQRLELLKTFPVITKHTDQLSEDYKQLEVSITAEGKREGNYSITWQVLDNNNKPIYTANEKTYLNEPTAILRHMILFSDILPEMVKKYPDHKECESIIINVRLVPQLNNYEAQLLSGNFSLESNEKIEARWIVIKEHNILMCSLGSHFTP